MEVQIFEHQFPRKDYSSISVTGGLFFLTNGINVWVIFYITLIEW